jgi:hypothetical protein
MSLKNGNNTNGKSNTNGKNKSESNPTVPTVVPTVSSESKPTVLNSTIPSVPNVGPNVSNEAIPTVSSESNPTETNSSNGNKTKVVPTESVPPTITKIDSNSLIDYSQLTKKLDVSEYDKYIDTVLKYGLEVTILYENKKYECFYVAANETHRFVCFHHNSVVKMRKENIRPKNIFYYNHFTVEEAVFNNRTHIFKNRDKYTSPVYTLYTYFSKDSFLEDKDKKTYVIGDSILEHGNVDEFEPRDFKPRIKIGIEDISTRGNIDRIVKKSWLRNHLYNHSLLTEEVIKQKTIESVNDKLKQSFKRLNESELLKLGSALDRTKNKMKNEIKKQWYNKAKNILQKKQTIYNTLSFKKIPVDEIVAKMDELLKFEIYRDSITKNDILYSCIFHSMMVRVKKILTPSDTVNRAPTVSINQTKQFAQYTQTQDGLWKKYNDYIEQERIKEEFWKRLHEEYIKKNPKRNTSASLSQGRGTSTNLSSGFATLGQLFMGLGGTKHKKRLTKRFKKQKRITKRLNRKIQKTES